MSWLVIVPTMLVTAGCSAGADSGTVTTTVTKTVVAASPDAPSASADADPYAVEAERAFWSDRMATHWVEIRQATEYLRPRQLDPRFILESVLAGDEDLEYEVYGAADTLERCITRLDFIGAPPPGTLGAESSWPHVHEYFLRACVSYAQAGAVFFSGLKQRELSVMRAAGQYIRDGDEWLRLSGYFGQ